MTRPMDALGVAGALLCCVLWGGNAVAVKYSVPEIPAFGCAGLRFAIALPVQALVCLRFRASLRVRPGLWWLILLHSLLTVAQIGTFTLGTSLGQASRASIFINIHPLVVAPLSWLLFGEHLGLRSCAGLGAATLGIAALFAERWGESSGTAGDLIVLGSGIIFGVQTIVQKKTFPIIPPTTLLLHQSWLAVPIFMAISGLVEGFENYDFTPAAVWGLLYQGLGVSGVCFATWILLLQRYPAGRLATLAFLTPLFGVAIGNLWRGEPLTGPLLLGGLLVGCGIILVATDRARHGEPSTLELPGEAAP